MLNVQSTRFAPPAFRTALLGLFASAAIFATATPAFAGTKEIAAVTAALPSGINFGNASVADLVSTFNSAVANPSNSKLKKGILLGEILRLAATDAGAQLAAQLSAAEKTIVAIDAIRTAGTGKAPKVTSIPSFAAVIAPTQTEALGLAKAVKSTKTGQGAVLGGFASTLGSDALKQGFANTVLLDKAFTANALNVAQGISSTLTGPAAGFVTAVVANGANVKFFDKLLIGTAAGKPLEAGSITAAATGIANFSKKVTVVAKGIGAVADIEQIQKVGAVLAPLVKFTQINALATTLGKAISIKPSSVAVNNNLNKVDELGELAAYILNAVKLAPELADPKKSGKAVIGLISAITKTAKIPRQKNGTTAPSLTDVLSYVYGSVALTLKSLPVSAGITQALADLVDVKKIKGLAALDGSKTGLTEASLQGLFAAAIVGGPKFESGLLVQGTDIPLTDPETNSRSF